jgi:hypothetical protein
MTPWTALRARLPDLAEKVRSMRPPKVRVVVDSRVVYWALAVPTSLEGWLAERLRALEEDWPDAREVELLGVWAGNPPRLERIARARVKDREGEVARA